MFRKEMPNAQVSQLGYVLYEESRYILSIFRGVKHQTGVFPGGKGGITSHLKIELFGEIKAGYLRRDMDPGLHAAR